MICFTYQSPSYRFSRYFEFRYPKSPEINVYPKVAYEKTVDVYHAYNVSLNVNSVTDSPTMCSRRLLEVLGSGGIMVTNTSQAVEKYFKDYCTVIKSKEEAMEILPKMVTQPSKEDLEKAEAGSQYVFNHHTWEKRLEQLAEDINF